MPFPEAAPNSLTNPVTPNAGPALTAEQRAIVEAEPSHCLITAVAGSGKTTTLAYRIRHLLSQGIDPRRILILMFNRAAKEDFERKLRAVCQGSRVNLPEVRTYHAMGYRLYQRFIQEGYLQPVKGDVLSEADCHYQLWNLIRQLAPAELKGDLQRDKKDHIEIASQFIERVKSTLLEPEDLFASQDYEARHDYLIELFEAFENWRRQERRITYADMLYEPVKLIGRHPELRSLVGNKMDILLVDEYQDTNEAQHRLLGYIAGSRAKVTVVGDPDQTIYEFRGARPDYLLRRFGEEFSGTREQTLSFSFRYGHRVALLANHLISHNRQRRDVLCRAFPGNPATHTELLQSRDEPASVLELVQRCRQQGRTLQDICVLVRVWSQVVNIELALLAADVPYRIDQHKGALFTRELATLMDLLAFADDRFGALSIGERSQAFQRILRFPHVGLKEAQLQELAAHLGRLDEGWSDWLLEELPEHYTPLQKKKLRQTARSLDRLQTLRRRAAEALGYYIEDTELERNLRDLALTHDLAEERIDRLRGLLRYVATLKLDCGATLDHLLNLRKRASEQRQRDGLHIATIHRSKGLEWPVVIIPGLDERYLPYLLKPPQDLPAQLESERRLLYVAMTRAREALYLLAPPAKTQPADTGPSLFLKELQFDLCAQLGSVLEDGRALPDAVLPPLAQRYQAAVQPKSEAPNP